MWHLLLLNLLLVSTSVFGASLPPCPEECSCNNSSGLDLICEDFEFLNKLVSKQYTSITNLTINSTSLEKVNPKLKYLKNLVSLDASHNNIYLADLPVLPHLKELKLQGNTLKDIKFSALPKNIEYLDLSNNYLSKFPKDWRSLTLLKTLDFTKNPVNCDCQNILVYEEMKKSIEFQGSVTCGSPKEYHGKSIESVECSSLDEMLMMNDEGSGAVDVESDGISPVPILDEENDIDTSNEDSNDDNIVNDEIIDYDHAIIVEDVEGSGEELIVTTAATTVVEDEEEGSGNGSVLFMPKLDDANEDLDPENETGSGMVPILANLPGLPKACAENCTDHKGLDDEEDASPLPGIKEQIDILNSDLFNINQDTTTASTTTMSPVEEEPIIKQEVNKLGMGKEVEPAIEKDSDKDNYTLTENTKLGRASIEKEGSYDNTVYIIMGFIFFALICTVIYFIKKRGRANNNRRKQIPQENFGEELKPLEAKSIKPLNEKIPLAPEHIPLMNGNGKLGDDIPTDEKDNDINFKEVDIRPKRDNEDLLTPKRERVTIKETEIPDSIPKTPLLVHREVSSDGKIVLTPVE